MTPDKTDPVPIGAPRRAEPVHPVDDLTYEIALLYFRLVDVARATVGQGKHSAGRRSVLRTLYLGGPTTSTAMARERAVSRQHVHKLVKELERDGLVTLGADPADARAKLVELTPEGRRAVRGMRARERALLDRLGDGLSDADLRTTLHVVRELRRKIDEGEWLERDTGSG